MSMLGHNSDFHTRKSNLL